MIIGLAGYARSGKDTVADYLVQNHGFTRLAFADAMREALLRLDPFIEMDGYPRVMLSQALGVYSWDELKEHSPDIRPYLQRFGTEVGRDMLGENIWVDYTLNKSAEFDRIVISDVRFENEAYRVHKDFGDVWRVVRPGTGPANNHISEIGLDRFHFDATLENSGTIEELHEKVELELKKIGLRWSGLTN